MSTDQGYERKISALIEAYTAFLDGRAPRPVLNEVEPEMREEVSALFGLLDASWRVGADLPPLGEDPVAVALGFVAPREFGGAPRDGSARRRPIASGAEAARHEGERSRPGAPNERSRDDSEMAGSDRDAVCCRGGTRVRSRTLRRPRYVRLGTVRRPTRRCGRLRRMAQFPGVRSGGLSLGQDSWKEHPGGRRGSQGRGCWSCSCVVPARRIRTDGWLSCVLSSRVCRECIARTPDR